MPFLLKRAYEQPGPCDGFRVLVDRLWPRGVSKSEAKIDLWLKEIAPSTTIRKQFNHDPAKWDVFRQCYERELSQNSPAVEQLKQLSGRSVVTLVYGAKDNAHNHALVLKEYLDNIDS